MKKNPILILIVMIFLIALPVIQMILVINGKWQGILPSYDWDELYYYARIREVVDGHPFIGNPYFLEHNSEMAPAFFVADWLSALPVFFYKSIVFAAIFNFLIWFSITVFLLYKLLSRFKIPKNYSLLGALFVCLQVYWFLLRPVTMQVVFPFMVLFWLAVFMWWEEPFKKRNIIFLVIAASVNFYIYSYSWQIVLVTFFLAFVFLIFSKQRQKLFSLIKIGFSTLIIALPILIYTFKQIQHSHYWETMYRVGLVDTHLPAYPVYSYGRWIVVFLLLYTLTLVWLDKEKLKTLITSSVFVFFNLTGLSLLFTSLSNVITGKDLEIADHVARFIIIWFNLAFFYYLVTFFHQIKTFVKLSWRKVAVISILITICLFGVLRNLPRALPFFELDIKRAIDIQSYAKPLEWLEKIDSKPAVVWADPLISAYIPIVTRHYVLFYQGGGLHLVSSKEVEERYLISRYFDNLNKDDIKKDFRIYAGAGNAKDVAETYNFKVRTCRVLRLNYLGYDCGKTSDAVSLKGKEYFDSLFSQYINEIRPNIDKKLRAFQVKYIIKDKDQDVNFQPEEIKKTELVYQDERFLIYRIIANP